MQRVFMILTSHRLDCFQLTMELLLDRGELARFDKVVLLLNGVVGKHKQYVEDLMSAHPDISWDTIAGPRGKGPFVANLQNECVKRYPDSLYFKVDEDVYMPEGWVDRMSAAYAEWKDDPRLGLLSPVVVNNSTGSHYLMKAFPELEAEYKKRFDQECTTRVDGPVWKYPQIAEWLTREFLNIDEANQRVGEMLATTGESPWETFAHRFSINNLVYDYRHWQELGGIPDDEEPAWCQWVVDQGKYNVLVRNTVLLHYSFFVQQDWLDRTSLLEDIRAENLPGTLKRGSLAYRMPRWRRVAQQVPGAIKRRLGGRE